MEQQKVFFKNSLGTNLCGIFDLTNGSTNNNKLVIMVHGNGSSKESGNIRGIASEIQANGINTFRIDLNGCGESEGNYAEQTLTKTVFDIDSAVKLAVQRGYTDIKLFGHSAGGNSVLSYLCNHAGISNAGVLAPVSDYPRQRLRKYGLKGIEEWKERGYHEHDNGVGKILRQNYSFFEDSKNHVIREKAKNIGCPILIVHGTADNKVRLEDSQELVNYNSQLTLKVIEGGDHGGEAKGSKKEMRDLFATWFSN